MPSFSFYGYTVRSSRFEDAALAYAWMKEDRFHWGPEFDRLSESLAHPGLYWIQQSCGHESFLVSMKDEPLAFFQIVSGAPDEPVRLYFQSRPPLNLSMKKRIMRGVTLLVPLIEKALVLRGVQTTFFVSRSPRMCSFMEKRLHYRVEHLFPEGITMTKQIALAQ